MEVTGKKVWQRWVFERLQELNYFERERERHSKDIGFEKGKPTPWSRPCDAWSYDVSGCVSELGDRSNESLSAILGHRSLRVAVNHFLWDSSHFSIQWMLCEMTCNYRWLDNERIANLHMLAWSKKIFEGGQIDGWCGVLDASGWKSGHEDGCWK